MKIAASVDLSGLFPFHVVFGRDLEIVQLGRSIAKVCIRSLLGSNFADEFPELLGFGTLVAQTGYFVCYEWVLGCKNVCHGFSSRAHYSRPDDFVA